MTSAPNAPRRAYWLKTLHEWHWISSAVCLVGMVLFAVTGFTLNHAASIEAKPQVTNRTAKIDARLREQLVQAVPETRSNKGKAELPEALQAWVRHEWSVQTAGREAEWSDDEIYLSLPRPGGDAWVRLNLDDGEIEYERTDRGWLSYFNDLHKGRNTGAAWSWFIDIFAVAALVFSITGLFILKMHAGNRPLTWPVAGMGLVIPVLLALLFIH
ncbi:PepSY-associated TM helix domain-containing protein [Variovorax ureilyticus]|uniref:PepSY-associated TM helix domain-containing protein n=1 Tax=Variovorax ureilyticus TaxID=1836198 RepID=A0ABU8VMJ8_9BURK